MKAPRIMIAAPGSGSGKTLFTCALLEALKLNMDKLYAYKCGPDYIDPMFHQKILGIPSKNLDLFFSTEEQVRELFLLDHKEEEQAFCVIEGVMGLYDGLGGIKEDASSYHLATTLDAPIVLVVDVKGMGRSVIPLLAGFLQYDHRYLIRGVVLNRASKSLCELLKPVIEEELQLEVLGYFPEQKDLKLESRHLGLKLPEECDNLKEQVQKAAAVLAECVDINRLTALGMQACDVEETHTESTLQTQLHSTVTDGVNLVRIGVARDEAFCFYYEDNLRILQELGAEIVWFSPLHDKKLPDNLDGILLGGGYPELVAKELSDNVTMRDSIARAIAGGMPSLAECGGFMYLHETLVSMDGVRFPMCGVIRGECTNQGKLVRFGYVELQEKTKCFLGDKTIKAHEFHYFDSTDNGNSAVATKPTGNRSWECVHVGENHWWGYAHLYYPSNIDFARHFISCAQGFRKKKK